MNRRQILLGTLAVTVLAVPLASGAAGTARAETMELYPDDRILGADNAPLTIIEYSSLTCPHCASLHAHALPRIKDTWIADGRARLVFRHYPLDGLALRAAAVADCIEGERFFAFLDLLYQSQERWSRASDPIQALSQTARLAGMSQEQFDKCVADEAEMDKILTRAQDGSKTFGIESTPTLIVNGKKLEGARSFEDYDKIFAKIVADS